MRIRCRDAAGQGGWSCRGLRQGVAGVVIVAGIIAGSAWKVPGAMAQPAARQPERLDPPTVPPAQTKGAPWYFWLAALPIIGLVVGANLIPSKRGHQD